MLSFYILILNIFFLYYVYSTGNYLIYKNDEVMIAEEMFISIFILLVINSMLIFFKNNLLTKNIIHDYFSKYFFINETYILLLLKTIILIISLFYFVGLSNLFIKVFLIENQIVNLDGIINIGRGYKLERIYSDEEKLNYALSVFNENVSMLNTHHHTSIQLNISPDIKKNIISFKTLKEIKEYCISSSNLLFNEAIQLINANNTAVSNNLSNTSNSLIYSIIKYTAITIFVCGIGYLGYLGYSYLSRNTVSTDLKDSIVTHVNTVTEDLKDNKKDIGNLGARQVELDDKWSSIGETHTTILKHHIDNNLKQLNNSFDLLKLIKASREESLKLINENKSNIDQVKQNLNQEKLQFLCSEKVFKVLTDMIFWDEKHNGKYFDALSGGLKMLFERSSDEVDSKKSFKNINENTPKITPFSGKGHQLDDDKKN